jgi:hypothetical protein
MSIFNVEIKDLVTTGSKLLPSTYYIIDHVLSRRLQQASDSSLINASRRAPHAAGTNKCAGEAVLATGKPFEPPNL